MILVFNWSPDATQKRASGPC